MFHYKKEIKNIEKIFEKKLKFYLNLKFIYTLSDMFQIMIYCIMKTLQIQRCIIHLHVHVFKRSWKLAYSKKVDRARIIVTTELFCRVYHWCTQRREST